MATMTSIEMITMKGEVLPGSRSTKGFLDGRMPPPLDRTQLGIERPSYPLVHEAYRGRSADRNRTSNFLKPNGLPEDRPNKLLGWPGAPPTQTRNSLESPMNCVAALFTFFLQLVRIFAQAQPVIGVVPRVRFGI
jgi:hypothetical protein